MKFRLKDCIKVELKFIFYRVGKFDGSSTAWFDCWFLTAALLVAPLAAEAKRAGGGKSHGMSRQAAPTQSYQQPRQATPAQQPTAPATAPAKSGPGVGGMVAAGVAGAAIGAVAANALADDNSASQAQAQEEKGGIPSWIWILLAAAVAFFIFRKMGAKK